MEKLKKVKKFLLLLIFIISLLSFKIISVKAETVVNNPILNGSDTRIDWGSNYWTSSNIREWLNSDSAIVNYTNQEPSAKALENYDYANYAYDKESGFLNEFSDEEKNAIAVTNHRTFISQPDSIYKTGGNTQMQPRTVSSDSVTFSLSGLESNWKNYYYQDVRDKVYLLNPHELYLFIQKRGNTIDRNVSNAVKNKYNYLDKTIAWYISGGADNVGKEETFIASESYNSEYYSVDWTGAVDPKGIVPAINLKPNYKLSNGQYVKDLNIGDDIDFGKHLGEAINWKVVNKQDGYAMLVANYTVDIKSYDSPGDKSYAYSNYINFSETAIDRSNPIYMSKNNNSDVDSPIITVLNADQLKIRQNDNFILSLKVTDNTNVKAIILPNGNLTTSTQFNYTVATNGMYTFIAYDINGNYRYFVIPVGNINVPPKVDISSSADGWTNKDVDVSIKATNDVGLNVSEETQDKRDIFYDAWTNYTSYLGKRIHVTGDVELVNAIKSTSGVSASIGVAYYYTGTSNTEYTINKNWYAGKSISLDTLKTNGKQHFDFTLTVPDNYFAYLCPWLQLNVNSMDNSYKVKWTNLKYELVDKDDFAINKIILPSGKEVYQSSYVDTLTENGSYTYKVLDNRGLITEKTIRVLIDKDTPTIKVSGVPYLYTNKDVQLSVSADDTLSGLAYIKLPNGSTTTDSNAIFNIRENGYYTFEAVDVAGNIKTQTIIINKIDKIAPTLTLEANPTDWTNGTVILTAKSTDSYSGVQSFKLVNGTCTSSDIAISTSSKDLGCGCVSNGIATYKVDINDTYTVTVYDKAGNSTTKSIKIANIDKTPPILNLTVNTTTWTNGSVIITATGSDSESGVKYIKTPDGNYIADSTTAYTVSSNGTYDFEIVDNAGNSTIKSITITNIDKTPPTAPTINNNQGWVNTSIKVTIISGTDNESGVKEIQYSLDGATALDWTSYINPFIITNEGKTNIKTRSINNAGLYSDESISIAKIDKTSPDSYSIKIVASNTIH